MISIFDTLSLTKAFEGHDAIINLTSAIPATSKFMNPSAWVQNNRVRSEGSAAVADAARSARVPRLIQESVCMLYRDRGEAWIDEDWPTDEYPMARANLAAEASAARFSAAGGVGVVLRFGWFHGTGATHSEEFLKLARHGICVMMGRPGGYVSSINVADGGAAVAAALRR
jgi:nucleoside-diphosphate-sugar epimerase